MALPRPSLISRPEWPPRKPATLTLTATSSASVSTSWYFIVAVMLTPPALPMTNSPMFSLSIFSRMSPFRVSALRWLTPYMQVSSSAVIRASRGPCSMSFDSKTAMMAATPIPSSAPNVVPFALSHSPSTHVWMGSVSKLCVLSSVFWGTMSMWACITAVRQFSLPGVAGLRITMFSALSLNASMPRSAAHCSRNSCTFCKCPLGRGTCVSRWKFCQISLGLRSLIVIIFVF